MGVMLLGEPWVLYRAAGTVRGLRRPLPAPALPALARPLRGGRAAVRLPRLALRRARAAASRSRRWATGATLPPAARLTAGRGGDRGARHGLPRSGDAASRRSASIPEADDASFMEGELPTLRARGSAGLLADNFLDIAHFPFVHAGTFGADEAAEVPPFTRGPRRLVVHRVATSTPSPTARTPGWRPACARSSRPGASPTG